MIGTTELYDLRHSLAGAYLADFPYPWQALPGIGDLIWKLGADLEGYQETEPGIWVHPSAVIAPTAQVRGPCIIGPGSQVRHGAFIRGSALIGADCVVGNSTELKNVILFDGVQVPHYNYVGDSILGYRAHMGAGSITSNVKADRTPVTIKEGNEICETGLVKCGAMVGDFGEIGCNAVLNPGTVVGRNATVYPLSCVRGIVPADCIYKAGILARKEGI